MYVIKNMEFYVKLTQVFPESEENDTMRIDYVSVESEATSFETISDAAIMAEDMHISGFSIEKIA